MPPEPPSTRRLTAARLTGLKSFMGLDLASTHDLAALAVLARRDPKRFFLLTRFWCPEDNLLDLERETRMPYRMWADKGFLCPTPGNVIDYGFIRAEINALAAGLDLAAVFCDQWNAQKLALELRDADGLPVTFIQQGYISLSAPTKEFKRLVDAGHIAHDDNPVMRWCVGNAVATTDAAENVKLDKKKSRQKIDGAAASVNAVAAYLSGPESQSSVYESRGVRCL